MFLYISFKNRHRTLLNVPPMCRDFLRFQSGMIHNWTTTTGNAQTRATHTSSTLTFTSSRYPIIGHLSLVNTKQLGKLHTKLKEKLGPIYKTVIFGDTAVRSSTMLFLCERQSTETKTEIFVDHM